MNETRQSTRVVEITPKGEAFFAWALSYPDQEALLECLQTVVMDAFVAGWDAREKDDGTP